MPFPFTTVCDLLQRLDDDLQSRGTRSKTPNITVKQWFEQHRTELDAPTTDACALLSTLLPQRRTDRVYGIQARKLQSIVAAALSLGASRTSELQRWETPGLGVDLADCVEGILICTPNAVTCSGVTVEEIDTVLNGIASGCRFSSPAIRASGRGRHVEHRQLIGFYQRLSARDAKWFTRLVLKDYAPVHLAQGCVLRCFNPQLPDLLKVQDDLAFAAAFIRQNPPSSNSSHGMPSSIIIKPRLGTKVGRQTWLKARSIKHCFDMGQQRTFSCQQKIDGEYCQIHIDLQKGYRCIHIFSKSGKDSTQDRAGLHGAIRDSLRIGKADCPFKKGCILEGELVVYSTKEEKILPFHKIRKHVSRSGAFLGTNEDSQPHEHEQLMIIYYDALMVDDESLLQSKQSQRSKKLREIVSCRKGFAEIVQQQILPFSASTSARRLREIFAQCIINREEGLVLKPDEPYFDFGAASLPFASCNIKLKKEYVQGWGDVGDFAVIGAAYDAKKARTYRMPGLRWTDFFIGCLENAHEVRTSTARPRFKVVNVVELNKTMLRTFVDHCNSTTVSRSEDAPFGLEFHGMASLQRVADVFCEPPVFDVRCFSFDKEPNTSFFAMRFPLVSKIHFDRSYLDCITFDDLQVAARSSVEAPDLEDSQEMKEWITALEKADPRGIAVDAMSEQTSNASPPSSPDVVRRRSLTAKRRIEAIEEESTDTCALDGQRRSNALTPPTSSAPDIEFVGERQVGRIMGWPATKWPQRGQKRAMEETSTPGKEKKKRKLSNASSPSTSSKATKSGHAETSTRQPLSQISHNPSQGSDWHLSSPLSSGDDMPSNISGRERRFDVTQDNQGPFSPIKAPTGSVARRSLLDKGVSSLSTTNMTPSSDGTDPAATPTGSQMGKEANCSRRGGNCSLSNCSLLLSPCVSSYAWLTQDLFKDHGITDFILEPSAWKMQAASAGRELSPAASCTDPPSIRRSNSGPPRKLCLVESRRKEATAKFLKLIERANLRRSNGKRDWIAVYDWRVVEMVTEQEGKGQEEKEVGDPWRKWYVGIA